MWFKRFLVSIDMSKDINMKILKDDMILTSRLLHRWCWRTLSGPGSLLPLPRVSLVLSGSAPEWALPWSGTLVVTCRTVSEFLFTVMSGRYFFFTILLLFFCFPEVQKYLDYLSYLSPKESNMDVTSLFCFSHLFKLWVSFSTLWCFPSNEVRNVTR